MTRWAESAVLSVVRLQTRRLWTWRSSCDSLYDSLVTAYLADARHPEEDVPHQVVAHTAGGRLHQDPEGVPQDGECGGEHEEAEDEGAYGVDDGVLGLEVDDQSSREYA